MLKKWMKCRKMEKMQGEQRNKEKERKRESKGKHTRQVFRHTYIQTGRQGGRGGRVRRVGGEWV